MSGTAYAFGDDRATARRLAVVAEVFGPTTHRVLTDALAPLHQRRRARVADPTTGLFDWRLRQVVVQKVRGS